MDAMQEYIECLRLQIGEAEVEAAMDLVRMDKEHVRRKDDRWRRMIDETRDLRRAYEYALQELARYEHLQNMKPIVIPK